MDTAGKVKTLRDCKIDATKHLKRRDTSYMECVGSTTIEIYTKLVTDLVNHSHS